MPMVTIYGAPTLAWVMWFRSRFPLTFALLDAWDEEN